MDLLALTEGYLRAQGFTVSRRARDQLIGNRLTVGEEREFVYVWVLREMDPAALRAREGAYLAHFKAAADAHPAAQKIVLVPSRAGLSREFEAGAQRWYGVKLRTPAQFFDTAFKWEGSPEAASALSRLKKKGEETKRRRLPQPFSSLSGGQGDDLLPILRGELAKPRGNSAGRPISLVIGPAGMGKSFLLASLFADLYENFQDLKRAQILAPRPLALLPEHIPLGDAPTVRSILRGFLSAEFARPLDQDLFEWRLTHGLACWLLDGLDEIISLDPSFFDDLLDLLTRPDGSAAVGPMRIVISVRDTLLATNEALREFLTDCGEAIEVYHLEPWKDTAKQRFVEMRLPGKAHKLIDLMQSMDTVARLSGIPYYLSLIVDAFNEGRLANEPDEVDLLSTAVNSILARDTEKGILDPAVTREEDVVQFAESIAVEDLRSDFRGVPVDVAKDWARLILPPDMAPEEAERWVSNLTQLALFSLGGLGQIQFAQELVEQYLLGQALLRALDDRPETFQKLLSIRQLPRDWLAVRIVGQGIRKRARRGDLITAATANLHRPVLFRNLLLLLLSANATSEELRTLPLDQKDLSGIAFSRIDLSGFSFRGCDLTDVKFEECVLRGASFAGAILNGTTFERIASDSIREADFGDLGRCHSLRVDRQELVGPSQVRLWLEGVSARTRDTHDPCPTALQLRHLFGKFVRPDGSARRSWLDERALLRGRRFSGAPSPDALVVAAEGHGYLIPKERSHVERPGGDRYAEIVRYVRDGVLSEGLRALLDDVCPTAQCTHGG